MPRGRIEKIVPTEILFSRLADPSSGSIATQSGAPASRISGSSDSSDKMAATGAARNARRIISSAATSISFCRSPSELTPLCRPVMPANGPSAMRSARLIDAIASASITAATAGPFGASCTARSRCERKVTRSSMAVPLSAPSAGLFQCVVPVGSPRLTTSQFAKLGKFSYLWPKQSFPYKGWCRWQAGFCGN